MALIEVPLNSFLYHFRRLTWEEEARLPFPAGLAQHRVLLAAALRDVSGLVLSQDDARKVIDQLPDGVALRIWQMYRADLPPDRYYSTVGLFEAPEPVRHQRRVDVDDEEREQVADQAMAKMEGDDVGRSMFEEARKEGRLTPARGDGRV